MPSMRYSGFCIRTAIDTKDKDAYRLDSRGSNVKESKSH